jgi:UDP-N-acetylglucosamine/UDP-N-acetylgalactosamine diphosphorylase
MFPIFPEQNKTLFQFIAEKVPNRDVLLAIMTSPENHDQTVDFFKKHHFFGLNPEQIDFFTQTVLPILDEEGELITDANGKIMMGPDGNGAVFDAFISSGLQEKWKQKKIEVVNVVPVDNPLADPFDPELIGCLITGPYDLVVKAVFRDDPHEKVGVLVEQKGRVHVVEYTELPESEKTARGADGELLHRCANITLLSLRFNVVKPMDLPLHLAHKAISIPTDPKPFSPNAWKFEKFIFDIFPLIERIGVLVYPRRMCFAPLKNLTGPDSVETVQKALRDQNRGE